MPTMLHTLALAAAASSLVAAESTVSAKLTGYGAASNTPAGSSTICCGLEGSERSATFDDPGVVAADNGLYPVNTKIYIPGVQKYFVVQDSCDACSSDAANGISHFDLWMGPTGYQDYNALYNCATTVTPDGMVNVIVDPNDGYPVDGTPLMDSNGTCDPNADWSRTAPGGSSGGGGGGGGSSGSCAWQGHCQGASCSTDDDCSDPYSCQNGQCA